MRFNVIGSSLTITFINLINFTLIHKFTMVLINIINNSIDKSFFFSRSIKKKLKKKKIISNKCNSYYIK